MASKRGNLLAIDQGTTNTKVLLVNPGGNVIARATRKIQLSFPQPAWVEQDAAEIWQSVREAIDECLTAARDPRPVAIALCNQR
jgi:glycerol kinase